MPDYILSGPDLDLLGRHYGLPRRSPSYNIDCGPAGEVVRRPQRTESDEDYRERLRGYLGRTMVPDSVTFEDAMGVAGSWRDTPAPPWEAPPAKLTVWDHILCDEYSVEEVARAWLGVAA